MLNLLLVDNDIDNIKFLINTLGDLFYKKVYISKICLSFDDTTEIKDYSLFDILIINENNIDAKDIYTLLENTKECRNTIIMISDEQHIHINSNFYLTNNVYGVINILNNLYNKEDIRTKNLEKILNIFEFNKSNIGYKYIIDLLNLCIDEKCTHIPTLNKIYDKIAYKYNLSSSKNIGWNIEKSINNMKTMTDYRIINKYFGFPPSPKIFLEIILDMYNNTN